MTDLYTNNKLTIAEDWFLEVGNPWCFICN